MESGSSGSLALLGLSAVISAVSAGIAGLVGFAAGVRNEKNVADRALLRETYERIFEHFARLISRVQDGKPKRWADFDTIGNERAPPVRRLKLEGRSQLLPGPLFDRLYNAETELISAGSALCQLLSGEGTDHVRRVMLSKVRSNTTFVSGRRTRSFPLGVLALDPPRLREDHFVEDIGLSIDVAMEPNRSNTFYAYRETVFEGTWEELLADLRQIGDRPAIADARGRITRAVAELEACQIELERRIRDPHPYGETLAGTMSDIKGLLTHSLHRRPGSTT